MSDPFAILVQAIIDDPLDLARRLVLADWLEEHGDRDWADYIRWAVQWDFADPWQNQNAWRRRLAHDLLSRHAAEWANRWYGSEPLPAGFRFAWRGGVPEGVHSVGQLPSAEMLSSLKQWSGLSKAVRLVLDVNQETGRTLAWLKHYPPQLVRSLVIDQSPHHLPASLEELARFFENQDDWIEAEEAFVAKAEGSAAAWLANPSEVRELTAVNLYGVQHLLGLFAFRRLERLSLPDANLTPEELRALFATDVFPRLRHLVLRNFRCNPPTILQASFAGSALAYLDLSGHGLSAAHLKRLFAELQATKLQTLILYQNCVGAAGLVQILTDRELPMTCIDLSHNAIPGEPLADFSGFSIDDATGPLKRLDLSMNKLKDVGAATLAARPWLGGIEELSLAYNWIGVAGIAALAHAPWLTTVETLDLSGNFGEDAGCSQLVAAPQLGRLRELNLTANRTGDATLAALAAAPALANLLSLRLSTNKITPAGIESLARGSHLTALRYLELSRNRLGQAGAAALAQVDWPALELLDLSGCELDDAALFALASAPCLRHLRQLDLSANTFTAAGLARFLARAKMPRIGLLDLQSNPLGDAACSHLVESPIWGQLYELNLADTQITTGGLKHLFAARSSSPLMCLRLDGLPLSAAAADLFIDGPPWPRLESLYLRRVAFAQQTFAELRQQYRYVVSDEGGPLGE